MPLSFPHHFWGRMLLVVWLATPHLPAFAAEEAQPFSAARKLYQEGKYAEAEEAYGALAGKEPGAALGLARAQAATGQRDKAVATLTAAAKKHADAADLPAELARLALDRGDYAAAEAAIAAALKLDPDQPLAILIQAEVLCANGKLKEADTAYKKLVDYYNGQEVKDPERLHAIGQAAGQFARWNRLGDQFSFLVNDFYPELVQTDPTFWQAHYEAGLLFSEKYNLPDAGKEFKAALAINPNAAEVQVALGELALAGFELSAAQAACEQALETNPQLLAALHLKADIHLANFEPRQAIGVLTDALKLHATHEGTRGRIAAAYASVDGLAKTGDDTRFGKLVAQVNARNPHAGVFYEALADALDRLRRWPAAARYYQEAMTRMPQLIAPPGQLGLMHMRLGEEAAAKKVLEQAFEIDPFNVRVKNSLAVLEVLDGYETLETAHFRIRFDPQQDKLIARYMGDWLEEVYPQLVKQMGFAPPEKSLFEVFSRAKNTDGHGWFSARMVGLPHIHPIGACAGKVVALQSPSEGNQRFNWSRVLKHEFVHVINLQQTEFNIPHWFTEAVAVLNEGYPRPQAWNDLLVEQSAGGKLFNLDSINFGFIRPHSSSEWTLAYCQASLYATHMLERYGDDAIAKMLACYRDNLTTPEALQRAFGVSQPDFERGYSEFLKKLIAGLPAVAKREMTPAEVQKALVEKPQDPQLLATSAQAHLARKSYPEARRAADAALAVEPRNQLANYVRARLHIVVGENKEALARLEQNLDRDKPQANLLALLAGLKLKSEDYSGAAELYELGVKHAPTEGQWLKSLAAVYLKSGNQEKLTEVLTKIAAQDPDELVVRKKLTQLALARGDAAAAARWSLEALRIFVPDAELHQWRAEALAALDDSAGAADEYAVAIELEPDDLTLRMALAQAWVKTKNSAKAKTALKELLERDPAHQEAQKLLEELGQ